MKISKKFNDFVYFTFPFINGLKKLLYILHFKLMMTLLYRTRLVNNKFSNLKLNIFIIAGFICSNKYMKQLILISHRCISTTLKRRLEFCLFSKKFGRINFSKKRERLVKQRRKIIQGEQLMFVANLRVYKSRKHYHPRNIQE